MAERALSYTERRGDNTVPAQSLRSAIASQEWHPTVVNLLVLVVLEIGLYAALRYAFRQFHGG